MKRFIRAGLLSALTVLLGCLLLCNPAQAEGKTVRALLVGVDTFVSHEDTYPVATNNVYAMQALLQKLNAPVETIYIPESPVSSVSGLTNLIHRTFGASAGEDINFLYLCTHGVYENGQAGLCLSDGENESYLTPKELEEAFHGIAGTKVIVLDACHSGAFIGKGLPTLPQELYFLGGDFKIITSSGAQEESWLYSGSGGGGYFFTQTLLQGLSADSAYPADTNKDGGVTLNELYDYLLMNHAASTVQMYPQRDDTVIYRYDTEEPLPDASLRSPIMDITFTGTVLSAENPRIELSFTAIRPIRVVYQIVLRKEGRWCFEEAQLIYDGAERNTAASELPGAVSAGQKQRSINLQTLPQRGGYALVQLVSIDGERIRVHGGRVLCVLPETQDLALTAEADSFLSLSSGRELSIFVTHSAPCRLSVTVVDENGNAVYRICRKRSTRPLQMTPEGSVFYWNGCLKDGSYAPAGVYRILVEAQCGMTVQTAYTEAFTIE